MLFINLSLIWLKQVNIVVAWWKSILIKNLLWRKKKIFESPTKCWICANTFAEGDVKVRDCYRTTGKYRVVAHRDCNIKNKLNHEIPIVFHVLKIYDSHLVMQGLVKFDFKINFIPNGLKKCISFRLNAKLVFIDSF